MKKSTYTRLRLLILLVLLFGLVSSTLYGQKKSINKEYEFSNADTLLALIPVLNSDFEYTDSLLNKFYSKPGFDRLMPVKADGIRMTINEEKQLETIITKIISKQYSKKELKNFPNLKTIIDKSEIEYLRSKLKQADFMLIPTEIRFGTSLGSTFGYSCFRLYDINTGDYIANCPMDFNVNSTDPRAQKNLSIILIGEISKFLRDKLINK